MSNGADNDAVLKVLLQEQQQYRDEIQMFDAHFFRVMVTYVTGLVAAFGWLGSQIILRAGAQVDRAAAAGIKSVSLSAATRDVIEQLAGGPFFFLFAAIPTISAMMFLFVARDWASLHERFTLLKPLADEIKRQLPSERINRDAALRLDSGMPSPQKNLRAGIEKTAVTLWFGAILITCVIILWKTAAHRDTTLRMFWWAGLGCGGFLVGLLSPLVVLRRYTRRNYQVRPGTGNVPPERQGNA
ncbi:MAG: hypothetical protein V1694_03630 [Candidatus Eisenbacteria bacterium]